VPLATACTFGSLTVIVLRLLRVEQLWRPAADAGVTAAAVLTFGTVWLLARTRDPDSARVRAIAWPPVLAGIVGATVDWLLHLRLPHAELAFDGVSLSYLGPAEPFAVGMLSASFGILGSLVLAPQLWVVMQARERGDGAEVARVTRSLVVVAWGLAFVAAAVALAVMREPRAPWVLAAIASLGLVGQATLLRRNRVAPMPATGPYR
jgi:hypothetical protein